MFKEKKKTMKKIITFILTVTVLFFCNIDVTNAAVSTLGTWDCVDSGKHMDWSGTSNYMVQFTSSVNEWNKVKPGVIRKDRWNTINDVTISDTETDPILMFTANKNGKIKFNQKCMDYVSDEYKKNCCLAALGYCLGLGGTNNSKDVMYKKTNDVIKLSENDMASYLEAYKEYQEVQVLKKIIGCFLSIVLLCTMNFESIIASEEYKLQTWDCVDSGKHMDWSGDTNYMTEWYNSVNTWNKYKPGVIRADRWNTICDIKIYDKSKGAGGAYAEAWPSGKIYFFQKEMDSISEKRRQSVITHEIGHALGIAHNDNSKSVMHEYFTTVINLHEIDKKAYDAAYKKYQ